MNISRELENVNQEWKREGKKFPNKAMGVLTNQKSN